MKVEFFTLQDCSQATGVVVVVDVIRAFTTAAYVFSAGACELILVSGVGEALELRSQIKGSLLTGEDRGEPIEGFDFRNSPAQLLRADLRGKRVIQRTSAGTQGMVATKHASILLAGSFCCAAATARYIQRIRPETVSFVATGVKPDGQGDEDIALAEYLSKYLSGQPPEFDPYLDRVNRSRNAEKLRGAPFFASEDVQLCAQLDSFAFAMRAERLDGRLVMRAVYG